MPDGSGPGKERPPGTSPTDNEAAEARHTADVGEEESPAALLPFPVVAIGASAGGLEAYIELLGALSPVTGMAFVLVPHLSAEHTSDMVNILSNHTKMPVRPIEHGSRPEPNQVFVLQPNMRVTMERGLFQLTPRPDDERIPMPIDRFFHSLGSDQKNRAIGIVLSGGDSDGALGLRAIKGEGGIAIVQDPDSARYGDMPRAGILADHVDLVLTPAQIAAELSRLAAQFFAPSLHLLEQGNLASGDEPLFDRILTVLRTVMGIDFRGYRQATLRRRTARRMILKRMESLADYVHLLGDNREELRNLHEDILINVTRFFRDASVFDVLRRDILPRIFQERSPDQQVRIWIAGCSTGEEVYSVAICLLEYFTGFPNEPPIQIFGTDASERSIVKARAGWFPDSILSDVSPERLRRFFVKTDTGYQVSKRLRDLCIFARQNLSTDPPFSRLDLISCRNVLIYLQPELQRNILSTFHYALRPPGILLLGRSESVSESLGLFTAVDRKQKFYARLGAPDALPLPYSREVRAEFRLPSIPAEHPGRVLSSDLDIRRAADRIVLARYAPSGVVVNRELEVMEVRGRPAPFLSIAQGVASLNLLRMAHLDAVPVLRESLQRAVESGGPVQDEIVVREDAEIHTATLEVLPVQTDSGPAQYFLALFLRQVSTASPAAGQERSEHIRAGREEASEEFARIQRDLTTTRLYLQSLIQERDSRNQELVAAYEEIQSSNEELQSMNEELETAKEELQSTNEELQTVNDELRNGNVALMQASNDLMNLLNSVNLPVVMLGSDLTIRQFTPPAERVMRLRAADIGRPIGEVRLNLLLDDVEPLLHEVLETLGTKELEIQDRAGRWQLLRMRPYRTADNKIEGLVLLLLDIDEMKRNQKALLELQEFSQNIIEALRTPVVVLNSDLRVRIANAAFRELSGLGTQDLERRSFADLAAMLWDWTGVREQLPKLLGNHSDEVLELEHQTHRLSTRHLRMNARSVVADHEPSILIMLEDVTIQKQAEQTLVSDRDQLAGQVRSTTEVLGRTREELHALTGRLFTSQEEERRRVARELHDDIGQKLAALEIEIEHLRQVVPHDGEELRTVLQNLRERTNQLSEDVRTLSHRLHPSTLDHFGLPAALKSLTEEVGSREGLVVSFHRVNAPEQLPASVAGALYRIAQEALRNATKYAGRTHVKVVLEGTGDQLKLIIRDLGQGFDMDSNAIHGLGMVSMAERARLVGGTFSVQSALGEGTTVMVTVPSAAESMD